MPGGFAVDTKNGSVNRNEEAASSSGLLRIVALVLCQPGVLGFVLPVDAGSDEIVQVADFSFHLSPGEALFLGGAHQIVDKSLNRFPTSPQAELLVRVNAVF
jgi:hypothetical protein